MNDKLIKLLDSYDRYAHQASLLPPARFGHRDHPYDLERWNMFVIACHAEGADISDLCDELITLLVARRWPRTNAQERATLLRKQLERLRSA